MKRSLLLGLLTGVLLIGMATAVPAQDLPEDFPAITININSGPSPGVIYLANMRRAGMEEAEAQTPFRPFLMAINNDGQPAFIRPIPYMWAFNFGRSELTGERFYYQVTAPARGRGAALDGVYRTLDENGRITRDFTATNGLPTQAHDMLFLPDGGYIALSQPIRVRNITGLEGAASANIVEVVIQEFDSFGRLVFEWRSWEHVRLTDTAATNEFERRPPDVVSYMHGNGLALDRDGHIILSARRFDQLIKINRRTGRIMWRMGGPASVNNEFTFIDDPHNGFSGQHHPTILPNGNLLLFDNGTNQEGAPISRVVEYALDQENRTARLVWSYADGRYAPAMGSAQRLPNGNTLIGWGTAPPEGPNVSEVTRTGEVVFALSLPPTQVSYRAYRFVE
jgi:hypothetical protein